MGHASEIPTLLVNDSAERHSVNPDAYWISYFLKCRKIMGCPGMESPDLLHVGRWALAIEVKGEKS